MSTNDEYQEWMQERSNIHAIISDLEEKKRKLSEQVHIRKLHHQIEGLEKALASYQNSDQNTLGLSRLEESALRILQENKKPMTRLEIWEKIKEGDPFTFVNFNRLASMGFVKKNGLIRWEAL